MPGSHRIDDGFSTTVSFSLNPNVKLWEKEISPPGIDAGGPTDTTTMRNTLWRTFSPKKLKSLTDASFSAAYATAIYAQANAMIGKNQIIEMEFADGSKIQFWGWLNNMTPQSITEGEQPVADCTIHCSNQDNEGNEVAPVYLDPEGDTNDTTNDA